MTSLALILRELQDRIGLDPTSVGLDTVHWAVRSRIFESQADSLDDYARILGSAPQEFDALVEEVVVPETWFFRDLTPFQRLQQTALQHLEQFPAETLRILSFPCSTGEEPYSVAMALLDAGIDRSRFQIEAADLSRRALALARTARYRPHSFRGSYLDFRDRYFQPAPDSSFDLHPNVTQCVEFLHGNILDPSILADRPPYHIALCRNLLIYMDANARTRVLRNLTRLLTDHGALITGHADTNLLGAWFRPVSAPHHFTFEKRIAPPTVPACDHSPRSQISPQSVSRLKTPDPERQPILRSNPPPCPTLIGSRSPAAPTGLDPDQSARSRLLDQARQLANLGRIDEAAACCQEYLDQFGFCADAYYLLGVVRGAQGAYREAETLLNNAVYLDTQHADAMLHLSVLAERRGDLTAASRWRERHRRAPQP